jgi:AcrR family transcriptional regulator
MLILHHKGGGFMVRTKQAILEASLEIFSNKGYSEATTLEISKKAEVSEMTLFRKFETKKNLFLEAVAYGLGISFGKEEYIDVKTSLRDFIKNIMHQKLNMISKNIHIVRMLIRESLLDTLPEDFEVTKLISSQVISRIKTYVEYHEVHFNPEAFAEMIVGLLLRFAVMEKEPSYHLMDHDEQLKYLDGYMQILNLI